MTRDIVSLFPHGSYPWAVACRGDGRFLAVGSYSRTVTIWDLANRRQARLLTDHPGAVDAVMWSPDGTSILTSTEGEVGCGMSRRRDGCVSSRPRGFRWPGAGTSSCP